MAHGLIKALRLLGLMSLLGGMEIFFGRPPSTLGHIAGRGLVCFDCLAPKASTIDICLVVPRNTSETQYFFLNTRSSLTPGEQIYGSLYCTVEKQVKKVTAAFQMIY